MGMNWYFKKNWENDTLIEIGYSHEKNNACDGVMIYDKITEEPSLKFLSKGPTLKISQRGFQFVCSLIRNNKLTEQVYNVRTG